MTLSGFALLWFVLAVGCVLAGTALTRRRAVKPPSTERAARRSVRTQRESGKQAEAVCVRCQQPLEVGARFCGGCGLHLGDAQHTRNAPTRLIKQINGKTFV